ncbi:MAG: heavy-metal-associated domain-containing protein, partial [Chloroflexi bacterium]|nr:heavy-metal-associated domain-containing protein [Chloroflexota bacterium]
MKAGKIGALAAALASACCVGPLLLAALGLGSLGLGATLGRYHWVLQGAAVVGLSLAWYVFLREKRRMYALASEMRNERTTRLMLSAATVAVVAFLGLNLYTVARASLSTPTVLEEARAGQKAVPNQAAAGALIRLPVEGMSCYTCELSVESKLKGLSGVLEARAS